MVKEVLTCVGGVVAGAVVVYAIYELAKYVRKQNELGVTPERAFSDDLNINEVKQWFAGKMNSDDEVGILCYPTEENIKKWNIEVSTNDHMIIQMVYNQKTNNIIEYREIAFTNMSDKLKDLLESNGGTVVLEK